MLIPVPGIVWRKQNSLFFWSLWALYHILTLNSGSIGQCVVQGEQKILSRLPCRLHVDLSPKKGFTT